MKRDRDAAGDFRHEQADTLAIEVQSTELDAPIGIVASNVPVPLDGDIRQLRDADAFSLLDHKNPIEVIHRRIVDEAEGLVRALSATERVANSNYRNARKNGHGVVQLPEIHSGDAFSFRLEAKYETGGVRSYSLIRSDEYRTGDEGFVLVRNRDGSVLVKVNELSGLTPTDEREQSNLFAMAQKWIHFYAEKSGITPDFLLGNGRDKAEIPKAPRKHTVKKLARTAISPAARAGKTAKHGVKRVATGTTTKRVLGVSAAITAMYAHVPLGNTDVRIGPVPMPQPIELLVDWNNMSDHKAQSFDQPSEALVLSFQDEALSGTIPANYDYDTSGVPNIKLVEFGDNTAVGNKLKPGMYRLNFNDMDDEYDVPNGYRDGACDIVEGDFMGKDISLFTQDIRVSDNANIVASLINKDLILICTADGTDLPNGASVYLHEGERIVQE